MATKKSITASDKKTTRSFLNQLIDVLQEDVSSSVSRRKYQTFVTGGIGPGVTSSLFQTVYDQDFTLQTANPIFDVTVGLAAPDSYRVEGTTLNTSGIAGTASGNVKDSGGKYLFSSDTLMMREKMDIYSQFAQILLGNRKKMFQLPASADTPGATSVPIDAAAFLAFKRLFSRDSIKRETYAMRFFQTASTTVGVPNIAGGGDSSGATIYTDIGSSGGKFFDVGGQYGLLVDAADVKRAVGLMYYDSGIAVLDLEKVCDKTQKISGSIPAMTSLGTTAISASFVPDFISSASIDAVVDHLCYTRFGSGSQTSITFQNVTNINSSLIFCRALADDFNYSSNPTYIEQTGDNQGRLTIYDPSLPEETQTPFTYITTIGLYDSAGGLVAVAKLSRPVEKNPSRDLTFRVRLDF